MYELTKVYSHVLYKKPRVVLLQMDSLRGGSGRRREKMVQTSRGVPHDGSPTRLTEHVVHVSIHSGLYGHVYVRCSRWVSVRL